ncbi:MAG: 50S ribosomal protein L13 [Bacteroidales bacterium]
MNTLSYKTVSANKNTVQKEWVIVDATDEVLGRLASRVAYILRGKHRPDYTPHVDCGDHVIVINADKVRLTGEKMNRKTYIRYTGYPSGQRTETISHLKNKKPEAVVEKAIKGMLPKSRLGSEMFRNLHVFAGDSHPHEAQQPKKLDLNSIK